MPGGSTHVRERQYMREMGGCVMRVCMVWRESVNMGGDRSERDGGHWDCGMHMLTSRLPPLPPPLRRRDKCD